MLRATNGGSRLAGGATRRIHTKSFVLNNIANPPQPKPKIITPVAEVKGHSHKLRNALLGTSVVGLTLLSGTVWYAMNDDQFHDIVVDYVPFMDSIVNFIEEQRFKRRSDESPLPKAVPRNADSTRTVKIPKAGVEARAISAIESGSPLTSALGKNTAANKDQNSASGKGAADSSASAGPASKGASSKKADSASGSTTGTGSSSSSSGASEGVSLPVIRVAPDLDPSVRKSLDSLNRLIRAVNSSSANEDIVHDVSQQISNLSEELNAIKIRHKKEIETALENQAAKYAELAEARAKELRGTIEEQEKRWSQEFQAEQSRIVDLYNSRLVTEIEATKKAVISLANNRIVSVLTEREKQFANEIAAKVETERDGRLSQLKELKRKVADLESLVVSSTDAIDQSDKYVKFHLALSNLKNVLSTATEPVALSPYLEELSKSLPDDPLVSEVVKAVPVEAKQYGVLTTSQLAARFKLLEPEIRRTSLLPPGAGVAGHVSSWLFSNLLWKKQGNPVGDDVESIIARAETALSEGRVTDAVVEINALKGWPKLLSQDWLVEGRKRSEVEFLVNILAEEGKVWTFSATK